MPRQGCSIWLVLCLGSWGTALSLEAASPTVRLEQGTSNVTIHFTGKLQSADKPQGPYRLVPNASSPWTTSTEGDKEFWRAWLSGVHVIATGGSHTVALREDGTLWAWGGNYEGQLGNRTFEYAAAPQPILPNETWQAVAAGGAHTLAVHADGTLWAWGYNGQGQLALPVTLVLEPVPVLGGAVWGPAE